MRELILYSVIASGGVACWLTSNQRMLTCLPLLLLIAGVALGLLDPMGFFSLSVCGGLIYFTSLYPKFPKLTLAVGLATAILIFTIMSGNHWLPGVHNLKLLDAIRISESSAPFSMYLNIDKAFIGLMLLIFFVKPFGRRSFDFKWVSVSVTVVAIQIAAIMPLALASGFAAFEPKFPAVSWIWLINNLVIVSISEESFFRGFIQAQLYKKIGRYSVLVAAILFGLAHYKGGPVYLALATVAGLFYGLSYFKTQRIEAPIVIHFLFNAAHFFLFSYPALA